MKPGLVQVVRIGLVAGKDVPVDMGDLVAVAGIVHLPGFKGLEDRPARGHQLLKKLLLPGNGQVMEFADMVFE